MAFVIRWATAKDARAIKALVRSAGINPMGIHWQRFLVAEDAGRIIGIGQIKIHGDGSRELASIATVPDRQRKGVATAIIRELLKVEATAGSGTLYLTCRAHNEKFYERFAFHRLTDPHGVPPYFRRLIGLINAAQSIGRVFGLSQQGMVMVRKEA